MKWLGFVIVGLITLVAVVAAVGWLLPRGHRASRTARYAASADAVFAIISDPARFAEWRSDVQQVELLPDDGRGLRFREHGAHGAITYRVEASEPPRRLVLRIADTSLAFGGSWTYELQPDAGGTSLTITEDGEVYNPIFRFISTLFMSQTATIDAYQAGLRRRLEG
jgi:Polyketide cyclase / dehydrase and lipid transport